MWRRQKALARLHDELNTLALLDRVYDYCASSKPRGFPESSTWKRSFSVCSATILGMFAYFRHLLGWILSTFNSRTDLVLENVALRQQLLVLHTQRPRRRLSTTQKLFWVVLRRLWSGWWKPLVLVTPRTVVEWHRAGFRLYWKWLARTRQVGGRKPVSREVQALIFRMAVENPTWGAPRIHGELQKLGFNISEPTVSRWLQRVPRSPDVGRRWLTTIQVIAGHEDIRTSQRYLHPTPENVLMAFERMHVMRRELASRKPVSGTKRACDIPRDAGAIDRSQKRTAGNLQGFYGAGNRT
jgi:hypothetical protein